MVKGDALRLVRDGEIDAGAMRRAQIGGRDLEEALRSDGHVADVSEIGDAYLERSGRISIVPRRRAGPRVVDVEVAGGVQTVRLVLDGGAAQDSSK